MALFFTMVWEWLSKLLCIHKKKSSAAPFNINNQDCITTWESAFHVTVFYEKNNSKLYDFNYIKIWVAKTIEENSVCQNVHKGYPSIVRLQIHLSSSS